MAPTATAWLTPRLCYTHTHLRPYFATRTLPCQFRRNIPLSEEHIVSREARRCESLRCAAASEVGAVEAPGKPDFSKWWQEVLDMQTRRTTWKGQIKAVNKGGVVDVNGRHGTTWKGQVRDVNKGGVVVEVNGLRGFIPLSRLSPDRLQAIERQEDQIGLPIAAKVIQVNIPERDLILSEQATMVEALAASLNDGDVVEGVVTRLMDYGAFVSLRSPDGGMHGAVGLIHISELAWSRVTNPETVVQPGSLVKCKVIKVDKDKGRIGLSLKQMEGDPLLENLDDLLPISDSSVPVVPANLPSAVEDICKALMSEEEIEAVDIGRQVEEKRAVSQDLQLWISKEAVQDGYNLVVRTGRLVQEIHVTTQMPGDRMKQAVQRVLRNLV